MELLQEEGSSQMGFCDQDIGLQLIGNRANSDREGRHQTHINHRVSRLPEALFRVPQTRYRLRSRRSLRRGWRPRSNVRCRPLRWWLVICGFLIACGNPADYATLPVSPQDSPRTRMAFAAEPADRPKQPSQRHEYQQVVMGVPIRIALYAPTEAVANKAATAAFERLRELEQMMSDYRSDSELMQLCRNAVPGRPQTVSPELAEVLSHSQKVACRSQGRFDVTVGPAVRLWRRARRQQSMPDRERLQQALALIGYRQLSVQGRQVTLHKSGMRLDLGGIAKGYATDAALDVLRAHGIRQAMIDAGGDIRTGDGPPGRDGWQIEIAPLQESAKASGLLLKLSNAAVATSGDAYQFVEIDGIRYSHIVDPTTGLGVTRRCSVTVIAPDGMEADSLASAVTVLGPEAGIQLIEDTPRTECRISWIADGRLMHRESSGFGQWLSR